MSARNMVRNLRDSGALETVPQRSPGRSGLLVFMAALFAGAVLYLGAVYGVPGLMKAMEKKPAPVSYAKPERPSTPLA